MKGPDEQKKAVDTRMAAFGHMVSELDPTRTWTCSGDGELGGKGHHGPAPTLSFHYAWQPFKQSNMIPNTAYWLEQGLIPWQGIAWDKTKPLLLSEDMYHPYCLKPPDGMAWWGGNEAYDIYKGGVFRTWFAAYNMLVDGYYYSGFSCWNPWSVRPCVPDNPLFKLGQLMPDWHIAVRKHNVTFKGGVKFKTEIYCYNQTFKGEKIRFTSTLMNGAEKIASESEDKEYYLPGGERLTFPVTLNIPLVRAKTKLEWQLRIEKENGKVLAKKTIRLTAYPKIILFRVPSSTALVDPGKKIPFALVFDSGRFTNITSAVKTKAENIIIAAAKMSVADGRMVRKAADAGRNILIIEADPDGWTPVPCNKILKAAFVFVRASHDPVMKNVDNSDLSLWGTNNISIRGGMKKPSAGNCDIIADYGYGQNMAAILRLYYGKGSIIACRMPLVSLLKSEAAAGYLLERLIKGMAAVPHRPVCKLRIFSGNSGKIETALKRLDFVFTRSPSSSLVMVNGSILWTKNTVAELQKLLNSGGTVIVDELTPVNLKNVEALTGDRINLIKTAEWIFNTTGEPEFDGISNSDLLWASKEKKLFDRLHYEKIMKRGKHYNAGEYPMADYLITGEHATPLTYPSAIAVWRLKCGRVIVNNLLWKKFIEQKKRKVANIIGTLLHNMNASISGSESFVEYSPIDISRLMNRGFWHRPEEGKAGWFGDENDDMRYFPVNVTGIDPVGGVPQPVEAFPAGTQNFGGIDFLLANPETNKGNSCIVLDHGKSVIIPLGFKMKALWFLGASGKILPHGGKIAEIIWNFADGTSMTQSLRAGIELNGYQYTKTAEQGIIAWIGRNKTRSDVVLWTWRQKNPFSGRKVKSLMIKCLKPIAVIAVSAER